MEKNTNPQKRIIEPPVAKMPKPLSEIEQTYYDSLQELDKIGVHVAQKIIPHVYSMERSYGFQKWKKK